MTTTVRGGDSFGSMLRDHVHTGSWIGARVRKSVSAASRRARCGASTEYGCRFSSYRAGDRIELAHLNVEVREVNASGAPTRARFTFDRPLDDAGLTFRYSDRSKVATWTLPPIGSRLQLPAATTF